VPDLYQLLAHVQKKSAAKTVDKPCKAAYEQDCMLMNTELNIAPNH
jgi:hypothetical protein